MKQLMVLVATVILGISISGVVIGLGGNAETLAGNVGTAIESVGEAFQTAVGTATASITGSSTGD